MNWIVQVIGGIGLFLLGMSLMSDGLKAMAGDALRSILMRFVRGPLSGLGWGALLTAMVQSSTATTLTTIGFVSAGLLSFPQAIGVIFGANIGTTSTGWLVSILGFKVSVGAAALPLVFVGAMFKLLGGQRLGAAGLALAGFGVLFLGLDILQEGMGVLATRFNPSDLPGAAGTGLWGHFLLVLVGLIMTVVMQSSSAAVATTLAALHTGAINLEQAAAMVIGQNIGTAVTTGIAAIGASTPAKRTALAHILFNVLTGIVALILFPFLLGGIRALVEWAGGEPGAASLAGFHTAFNVLGVLMLLPLHRQFAAVVKRLIPERGPAMTRFLDESVARTGPVGTEAARRTAIEIARAQLPLIGLYLKDEPRGRTLAEHLGETVESARRTRDFLSQLSVQGQGEKDVARVLSTLHAVDHLTRLAETCLEDAPARGTMDAEQVAPLAERLTRMLEKAGQWCAEPSAPGPAQEAGALSQELAAARRAGRHSVLEAAAMGRLNADRAAKVIEAMLWADRVGYHLWRALHHLQDPPPAGTAPVDGGRSA